MCGNDKCTYDITAYFERNSGDVGLNKADSSNNNKSDNKNICNKSNKKGNNNINLGIFGEYMYVSNVLCCAS